MAGFISDADMERFEAEQAKSQPKGFISDSDMESMVKAQPKKKKVGALDTAEAVIHQGLQGTVANFGDEIAGGLEAAGSYVGLKGLGGAFSDIGFDDSGRSASEAYREGRDKKRALYKKHMEQNPVAATTANVVGSVLSPVNKIAKGMSLAKGGAALGGIFAAGNSEADSLEGFAKDTAVGVALGGTVGKVADKAAPYVGKAADKVSASIDDMKQAVGSKASEYAEQLAVRAAEGDLKAIRMLQGKGKIQELGRWMLDNKVVKRGGDLKSVAERAASKADDAGLELDRVYSEAQKAFGEKMNGIGFDPLRDKSMILDAARKELGQAEGAAKAISRLETYLDEVAARHGDLPNEAARAAYRKEVAEYLPRFKTFLKDQKAYRSAVGRAGENLDQPVLAGMTDDLQRTEMAPRQIELQGRPAAEMRPQASDFGKQMDLMELPTPGPSAQAFNSPRGDNLTPFAQRMAQDQRTGQLMLGGEQGLIEGTELTARTMQNVNQPIAGGARGQTSMVFQPQAPQRPVAPTEVRNPMSPRAANEVKSALDDTINYARNPLNKEPTTETAFKAARRAVAQKVDEAIDSLGGDELVGALKSANRDYGNAVTVRGMAQDRLNRQGANRLMGLTDFATGGAAVTYGALTDDWKTAGAMFVGKKAFDRFGAQGVAVMLDDVAQKLLKNPKAAELARTNPEVFRGVVARITGRLGADSPGAQQGMPRAAESDQASQPLRGEDKWANDGLKKIEAHTGQKFDSAMLNDRAIRKLLIEASDMPAGSRAMENIAQRIQGSRN